MDLRHPQPAAQQHTLQQRSLSSPESSSSRELESVVSSTQLLNTQIHDHIKVLASDTQKTPTSDPSRTKKSRLLGQLRTALGRTWRDTGATKRHIAGSMPITSCG